VLVTLIDVPVPLSVTVCGEPGALSVAVSVPERDPEAVGVNVTEIVQLAPAATAVPQVFIAAKSPETAIEVIETATVPEFERVTVCAALVAPVGSEVNVRLVGERFTDVEGVVCAVPVPDNATLCGELDALSVRETEALMAPEADGANVIWMVHDAPLASVEPQPLDIWKAELLAPVSATAVMFSVAPPELVSVTVWTADVVLTV